MMAQISEERRAFLSEIGRRGGKKRAESFTPEHQRAARAKVKTESLAKAGHRGAMRTIELYGYARLWGLCREYRLNNPSEHEQAVIDILERCFEFVEGRDYEREYQALGRGRTLSVDFAFPAGRKAIEVNGKVHYDPLFDDPRYPGKRQQNDEEKLRKLERASWRVLVIDYREMHRAETLIKEFIYG